MLAGEPSSPETRAARPLLSLDHFCIAVYERNRTSASQVSRLRNIAKLIPPPDRDQEGKCNWHPEVLLFASSCCHPSAGTLPPRLLMSLLHCA